MRLQSLLHFLTWLDPSFPFPSVSGGLGFSPKCVWISKRYACKTSTASFCSTGLTRFWFILILLSVPVHQVSYKWYGVCLPYWFRYSLFLSLLSHIRLPSGISVKGYGTFFHIPAYLPQYGNTWLQSVSCSPALSGVWPAANYFLGSWPRCGADL